VQADFAVELGMDDETLEMPWASGADGPKYYDLKRHPELLREVTEAQRYGELGEFLAALNATTSAVETAKCDCWARTEINPEEEIFGAGHKFGSYVDLLFSDEHARFLFAEHERWANRLAALLKKAPELSAAAEFIIRRCYYHVADGVRDGFYITLYVFGYGEDEPQARQHWAIGLKLVENAIRQIAQSA
jgi:hypothetical protein